MKIDCNASRTLALALAGTLLLGAATEASAQAHGARAGGGGRMAQSSVAANRGGGNRNSAGNRNNVGNNVNIGNDVDIDIDHGYGHGHGHGYYHHPVAAGIVIGTVAVTTAAAVGSYYRTLPASCSYVEYSPGKWYYRCGSVWYSRSWYGNDVVYVVVNP